ncbi:MAG: hypothetical protein EXR72_09880 [Myxococcales bacterium]|nr:hypothetical protein [Myxococcales bacterium]
MTTPDESAKPAPISDADRSRLGAAAQEALEQASLGHLSTMLDVCLKAKSAWQTVEGGMDLTAVLNALVSAPAEQAGQTLALIALYIEHELHARAAIPARLTAETATATARLGDPREAVAAFLPAVAQRLREAALAPRTSTPSGAYARVSAQRTATGNATPSRGTPSPKAAPQGQRNLLLALAGLTLAALLFYVFTA